MKARILLPMAVLILGAWPAHAENPPDYPMWCHGAPGMAHASGAKLVVVFKRGTGPAGRALPAGTCSWLDRGVNPNEPNRIESVEYSATNALVAARALNSGGSWSFWVYNNGPYMKARISVQGLTKNRPMIID